MKWKIIKNDNPYKEYSDFEYLWVDIFLSKGLLYRQDLVKILKHFDINFVEKNWEENISLGEMGTVLHGDVKKDVLLPFLQNYIHQNYPKIFGFEEASKIYNALIKIDSQLNIIKLWFAFECDKYDKNLKSFLEEKLLDLTKGARVKDNAEIGLSEEKDNYCQWCVVDILTQMYRLSFINEDIKKNYFEENYDEFRYQWLIIILCRELLPRKDMLAFLKHYDMRFFGINWKNRIKLEEMGWVILHDVEEDDLFDFLSNYLKEKYPKLFSFEEACKIFDALFYLKNEIQIMEVWLNMADESPYVSYMREQLDYLKEQREGGVFDESPSMEEKRKETGLFRRTAQDVILALYELAMKNYFKKKQKASPSHLYGNESSKGHDDSAAVKCMQEYLSRKKAENDF